MSVFEGALEHFNIIPHFDRGYSYVKVYGYVPPNGLVFFKQSFYMGPIFCQKILKRGV